MLQSSPLDLEQRGFYKLSGSIFINVKLPLITEHSIASFCRFRKLDFGHLLSRPTIGISLE